MAIKRAVFTERPVQKKRFIMPNIVLAMLFFVAVVGMFYLVTSEAKVLTDSNTPELLQSATQSEETFVVEWLLDSMDRGNHELIGELIVSSSIGNLSRGDIVYFDKPETIMQEQPQMERATIARVVGVAGEIVEIKNGQVYINDVTLNTFYGKAITRGLDEQRYFEQVPTENIINKDEVEAAFRESMAPITENTVFVLTDDWHRGVDSRLFGPVNLALVQGEFLGYK